MQLPSLYQYDLELSSIHRAIYMYMYMYTCMLHFDSAPYCTVCVDFHIMSLILFHNYVFSRILSV